MLRQIAALVTAHALLFPLQMCSGCARWCFRSDIVILVVGIAMFMSTTCTSLHDDVLLTETTITKVTERRMILPTVARPTPLFRFHLDSRPAARAHVLPSFDWFHSIVASISCGRLHLILSVLRKKTIGKVVPQVKTDGHTTAASLQRNSK
mmetsp:Transcript_33397/g.53478  ORF Transcript_33397/g.53478 Transcript_33397/m.53478 type:complete len:151 (-) Transcript_33397:541-993(-)